MHAATRYLSNYSGDFKSRMTAAVNQSSSGDVISVNVNLNANSPYTLTKSGLTLTGNGTITANGSKILNLKASNTTIKNITFNGGTRTIDVTSNGTLNNITFDNVKVKNGPYRGIGFYETNINNITVKNCTFTNKPFSVEIHDCAMATNVTITNNTFNSSDHQVSLDCADLGNNLNHSNIRITNNTFNVTARHNLALANMKASLIKGNVMKGGTAGYTQCVHIEDRTRGAYIKENQMTNWGNGSGSGDAVIIYTTDRFGHGTGALLTPQQKRAYASGPVSLENNTIIGAGRHGVLISYLQGKANFWGNNQTLKGNNKAIFKSNIVNTSQLNIADSTKFKNNRTWGVLKNWSPSARSGYVNF
ncbi:MAG: hypothetical protein AAFX93_01840 [Verrucomicrobiota bacterium]